MRPSAEQTDAALPTAQLDTSSRPDKVAHDAVELLAVALEGEGRKVQRYTPSIKIGRRYLMVEVDGVNYSITMEVEA